MSDAILIYDDDCGFCTWWAEFFEARSSVPIVGFSDLESGLRNRLPEDYERCSHLVTDEMRYSCGASIEEAFVRSSVGESVRPVVEFLRRFDTYSSVREWLYRRAAGNRVPLGKLFSRTPPASEEPMAEPDAE